MYYMNKEVTYSLKTSGDKFFFELDMKKGDFQISQNGKLIAKVRSGQNL